MAYVWSSWTFYQLRGSQVFKNWIIQTLNTIMWIVVISCRLPHSYNNKSISEVSIQATWKYFIAAISRLGGQRTSIFTRYYSNILITCYEKCISIFVGCVTQEVQTTYWRGYNFYIVEDIVYAVCTHQISITKLVNWI